MNNKVRSELSNLLKKYDIQGDSKTFEAVFWYEISAKEKLSFDFIREFQNELYWPRISRYQILNIDFIREFWFKVDWHFISQTQELSIDLIREFQDKVDWNYITPKQNLNLDFIREFKYKLNWVYISEHLSAFFSDIISLKEFEDYIDWPMVKNFKKEDLKSIGLKGAYDMIENN